MQRVSAGYLVLINIKNKELDWPIVIHQLIITKHPRVVTQKYDEDGRKEKGSDGLGVFVETIRISACCYKKYR